MNSSFVRREHVKSNVHELLLLQHETFNSYTNLNVELIDYERNSFSIIIQMKCLIDGHHSHERFAFLKWHTKDCYQLIKFERSLVLILETRNPTRKRSFEIFVTKVLFLGMPANYCIRFRLCVLFDTRSDDFDSTIVAVENEKSIKYCTFSRQRFIYTWPAL